MNPVSTIAQMGQQAATAVACGHHHYGQDPGTLSSNAFQHMHQTQPGPVQSTAKGNESRVHHILTQSLKCANPVLHGLSTCVKIPMAERLLRPGLQLAGPSGLQARWRVLAMELRALKSSFRSSCAA